MADAEKRRNARLEEVLSKELLNAASQFFAENSVDMVNLIKKIIINNSDLTRTGSNKSERDVTNFAEHCVTTAIRISQRL